MTNYSTTTKTVRARLLPLVLLFITCTGTAHAQSADTRKAIATTVQLFLHDEDARPQLVGTLLRLGPETLTMLVNGTERELPWSDVARIDVPRDSLKNGAIIGAVVLGAWCAYVCGQGLPDSGQLPAAILANAGFGALVGAGIDALNGRRRTIYRRPTPQTAAIRFAMNVRF